MSGPLFRDCSGSVIPVPYSQASVNDADLLSPVMGNQGSLNTVNLYYGGGTTVTLYVARICHNEKGQRLCIQYGNNTVTRYSYDPDTFRLTRLLTTVNSGASILQDLNYYYDPVGNITYLIDNAQPPIYYNNQQILSDGNYTYDAIYRLINATGREQIGQNTVDESAANTNYRNYPFDAAAIPAPGNLLAMRNYIQSYSYDAMGNMLQLQHVAGVNHTRNFVYNNSPAHPGANNQLLSTTVGAGPSVNYTYDGHGNMLNLPELPGMAWNYQDQFVATTQQAVSAGTGQTTYYSYDASGMRARKVTMGAAAAGGTAALISERLYIGPFEIYRTYDGAGNVSLQRETLHVMDDKSRIATIDNKTIDSTGGDGTVLNTYYPRYQYGNHLGSSAYELDDSANIVSYEEYHPFGTTSFQAMDPNNDVPLKRYRYTGKERDEESGLYYHGARYYAPWLCRWVSADPTGIKVGLNLYRYCSNNPVSLVDPNGTADAPPAQMHIIEQTNINTIATRAGYSQEANIVRYVQNMAASFGLDPKEYHAGHHEHTPQWSTPTGSAQKIGPQHWLANLQQSSQEAKDRDAAVKVGQFGRTDRIDPHPGVSNPPPVKLPPEVARIAKQDTATVAANANKPRTPLTQLPASSAAKPAPVTPVTPAPEPQQTPLQFNKPPAPPKVDVPKPDVAAAAATTEELATTGSAATTTETATTVSSGTTTLPSAAAKVTAVTATGAATTVAGAAARTFVPGAAEVLDTAAAVGLRGTAALAGEAALPVLLVGAAGAAGAGVGYLTIQALPPGAQNAIGSTVTGSSFHPNEDAEILENMDILGWHLFSSR